jgi:hypothetical protein
MKIRYLFVITLVLAGMRPLQGQAQPWAGIISPSRATDWSQAGVAGGIPTRTTICSTLNPGATLSQVNTAISNCPTGQVVKLNAGTYNLGAGTIRLKSQVTLRGSGADQTKLVFTGRGACGGPSSVVCFPGAFLGGGYGSNPQNVANWTAGYAQGTTTITLSSTANLQAGDFIKLDQLDDTSDGPGTYVCATGGVCSYTDGGGETRPNRLQGRLAVVQSVSGNNVTLRTRIHAPNWSSAKSPQATWTGGRPFNGGGLEDLTVDVNSIGGANGTSAGIVLMGARDSWVKGVRVVGADRNYVLLYQAVQITIRDNYFYGCGFCEYTNYGIEFFGQSSDNLIENNIFQHNTVPTNLNDGGIGNVIAYNFSIDNTRAAPANQMMHSWYIHSAGTAMNLFEGNSGLGFMNDDWYGTAHFATVFRNHLYGDICSTYLSGCPTKNDDTAVVTLSAYSRFFNVIGNVLGRTGYYNTYEPSGSLGCGPTYIYCLGHSHATGGVTDAQVKVRLMRWANYDTVNGAARFVASEVPSGLTQYANPVPSSQTLPASFYLAAKPAWFGSVPWPAVGPDVTNGNISGYSGRANKIPSRLCWENSAVDTAYGSLSVRTFVPATCYAASSAMDTPTLLRELK